MGSPAVGAQGGHADRPKAHNISVEVMLKKGGRLFPCQDLSGTPVEVKRLSFLVGPISVGELLVPTLSSMSPLAAGRRRAWAPVSRQGLAQSSALLLYFVPFAPSHPNVQTTMRWERQKKGKMGKSGSAPTSQRATQEVLTLKPRLAWLMCPSVLAWPVHCGSRFKSMGTTRFPPGQGSLQRSTFALPAHS